MSANESTSLILGDKRPEQLQLLTSDELPAELFQECEQGAEGRNPEFTGARLFSQNKEKYLVCVSLLAEGVGVRKIADLLKISGHTVIGIARRERGLVATLQEHITAALGTGLYLAAERINEQLLTDKTISGKDLAVIVGILNQNHQLLTGGATSRVDHTQAAPDHDEYNRLLTDLSAGNADQKDVIDADWRPLEEFEAEQGAPGEPGLGDPGGFEEQTPRAGSPSQGIARFGQVSEDKRETGAAPDGAGTGPGEQTRADKQAKEGAESSA